MLNPVKQTVENDPFACLVHSVYVSGQLTLVRTPAGSCGEWLCLDESGSPVWYRRLDACCFVWLAQSVKSAIRSGKISEAFTEALVALDWIRETGIQYGCFTANEVASHIRNPDWWSWDSNLPRWADEY